MSNLTIGKLAKAANVTVETIRFYERKSLLSQPETQERGFRVYPNSYIDRIFFIKRSQELGFTLKEIKEILDLQTNAQSTCGDVLKRAEVKIKEIDEKLQDLNAMKASLLQLGECCDDKEETMEQTKVLDYMMKVVPSENGEELGSSVNSCC